MMVALMIPIITPPKHVNKTLQSTIWIQNPLNDDLHVSFPLHFAAPSAVGSQALKLQIQYPCSKKGRNAPTVFKLQTKGGGGQMERMKRKNAALPRQKKEIQENQWNNHCV
jgi:hypothetical protein